ncbi:MAG: Acetophenone carboxylase gamma subunit [Myxococcota bacterium]|nr:Acetophenone carboxylase gamma subunit [Myxococcota bacterium]
MSSHPSNLIWIGVDTGGTFTDISLWRDGRLEFHKVPSTPDDPGEAIAQGLRGLGVDFSRAMVIHGATVATNALLQRKGARTALVVTKGFRDLLETGRQNRPRLYDPFPSPPPPLIPRELRFEADERITHDGQVLIPLTPDKAEALARDILASGAEIAAVCLLHSHAWPRHEQIMGEALRKHGLPFSLSCIVMPEFREYERASAVCVNAFVSPVMRAYLDRLRERLPGARVWVMSSGGAMIPPALAGEEAVRTILSGPAGGMLGAIAAARRAGVRGIVTFDMGGTSTEAGVAFERPAIRRDHVVDGLPIGLPMMDIHTIGAGGGSIAWKDRGGALRVGPQSAGARPGPACYGQNGPATVTDANLVLGRLQPNRFLGGAMRLDPGAAERALQRTGDEFGMDAAGAAAAMVDIVNAAMVRAIKAATLQRGHDPRDLTLVSFGGAGGLHACELAAELGMRRVLIPSQPGLLSALGMLQSELARDLAISAFLRLPPDAADVLSAAPDFSVHFQRLAEELNAMAPAGEVRFETAADARYEGQSHELTLPWTPAFIEDFHRLHEQLNGVVFPDRPIEVTVFRLRAHCPGAPPESGDHPAPVPGGGAPLEPLRFYVAGAGMVDGVLYDRALLPPGHRLQTPCIVTEYSATAVIPPGARAQVDATGQILVELP